MWCSDISKSAMRYIAAAATHLIDLINDYRMATTCTGAAIVVCSRVQFPDLARFHSTWYLLDPLHYHAYTERCVRMHGRSSYRAVRRSKDLFLLIC
jgi:hypothetical protein